ncbi:MAG: cytochrome d ubiquinol oxidase subunit II [candidate division KSB1 bacterium]|nr:cytochrome d ubiquinol oxidase subunit II [candidate division KSB1 bacterium]MDZ7392031.1 cytochrome d ubiquinol oxidase subunit II [candidate division KSB1 bacterium]
MPMLELLQVTWFVLVGALLAGYSILDGFDLGIGILFPFLGKKEEERRVLLRSIAPVWDGNEVWLLTGGGALFAAFPHVYATVFSGFYAPLMLTLWALIFRAVAPEFRSHDPKRAGLWDRAFVAGSVLPALLLGTALGNVIAGIPLDERMEYAGSFLTVLRPFPLLVGLLGVAACALQGSTYAALKTEGALQERAVKAARMVRIGYASLFVAAGVAAGFAVPEAVEKPLAWVGAAVAMACLWLVGAQLRRGRFRAAFWCSSAAFLALWLIVGAIQFPYLVRASGDNGLGLTAYNASSGLLTLQVMTLIALVGMPVVIGYTIYVYRVFRGPVRTEEAGY